MRIWIRSLTAGLLALGTVLTLTGLLPVAEARSAPASQERAAARPGRPPVTATRAGSHRIRITWRRPAVRGPRVTGYHIWRNGRDLAGRRTWSRVLPASRRSLTVRGLRNGTRYTFSVAALSSTGRSLPARVRRAPAAVADAGIRPVVVQSAPGRPVTLRQGGATGVRMRMAGVCVWGVPDIVAGGGEFAASQHRDRARVVAGIKSWGANHLRLRVLADDYNNDRQGLSKARRLQMIKDWRDTATAAGLYFSVVWWDSLDGYAEDGNWPSRYRIAFAMMADVHRTLGNDDRVFYEPFNEPNSFGDQWPAWSSAMRATVAHWRSIGYTGVLLINTPVWSHAYDDAAMTALETYDAGRPGMVGKHQLAFARHDYANEGWPNGGDTFSGAQWRAATGGTDRDHLIWESEFGNYNGDPSTVHPSWSRQAASFFADQLDGPRPNYVGYTTFVWGPWWDANALTEADNSTPTLWGRSVRNGMLRARPTFY